MAERHKDRGFRDIHDDFERDQRSSRRLRRRRDRTTESDEMETRHSTERGEDHDRRSRRRHQPHSSPPNPTPFYDWVLRPSDHLHTFEQRMRRRLGTIRADCSEFITMLPTHEIIPPKTDATWFFERETALAARRDGQMIIIDCLDLAINYGQRWGEIDFSGVNVAIKSFLAQRPIPAWKLVMFEHEWDWWKSRRKRTWANEERFLHEISKTQLIDILPSGPTYNTHRQMLVQAAERSPSRCRPLLPWEPLQKLGRNWLQQDWGMSPEDIAACCAAPYAKTGRLLGQVCALVEYVINHHGMLLCNDYRLFPSVGLLKPDLFRFICDHKLLYTFVAERLIIQQESIRNTYKSMAVT